MALLQISEPGESPAPHQRRIAIGIDLAKEAVKLAAKNERRARFITGDTRTRIALNDGSLHRVDYSVRENLGLFGWTWNVNWCVSGLDRHRSYAPDCKMARP